MAPTGTYRNPANKYCFTMCKSCFRCDKRGSSACPSPNKCSGRPDKEGIRDPKPDDFCDCKNGVMRWVTKKGQLIIRRYTSNPFAAEVTTDTESTDDRDWGSYVAEQRELLNDEFYDPIVFDEGGSTYDWQRKARNAS